DLHLLCQEIFHRMIRAVVSEFQFERADAKGQTAELMPEPYPENRDASEQLPNILNSIANRFGIARTIGKKNAVRLERENVFGGRLRWDDNHFASVIREQSQNVLLDSKIVGHHAVARSTVTPRSRLEDRGGEINRASQPIVFFR